MPDVTTELPVFKTTHDMTDSLKLDASVLTPKQDREIKNVARNLNRTFVTEYKKFISDGKIKEISGIEDRVLITDDHAFNLLWSEWNTIDEPKDPPGDEVLAAFLEAGNLFTFKDFDKYWAKTSEPLRVNLVKKFGTEDKASAIIGKVGIVNSLAHELIHQYQNHRLPHEFLECAVRYYEREVLQKLSFPYLSEHLDNERISFYESLIQQYGDDVHKFFFGEEIEYDRGVDILEKVFEESDRLFPGGLGLAKKTVETEE